MVSGCDHGKACNVLFGCVKPPSWFSTEVQLKVLVGNKKKSARHHCSGSSLECFLFICLTNGHGADFLRFHVALFFTNLFMNTVDCDHLVRRESRAIREANYRLQSERGKSGKDADKSMPILDRATGSLRFVCAQPIHSGRQNSGCFRTSLRRVPTRLRCFPQTI